MSCCCSPLQLGTNILLHLASAPLRTHVSLNSLLLKLSIVGKVLLCQVVCQHAGNSRHLQSLVSVATTLQHHLAQPQQTTQQHIHTVNEFLFSTGLDTVNMFKLIRWLRVVKCVSCTMPGFEDAAGAAICKLKHDLIRPTSLPSPCRFLPSCLFWTLAGSYEGGYLTLWKRGQDPSENTCLSCHLLVTPLMLHKMRP